MYKNSWCRLCCILLLCCCSGSAHAQWADDMESWHNVGVSYEVNKSLDLTVKYILGNRHNFSQFSRSYFSLQADQDITKWLRVGAEYRYATSYEADFHRFWLYAIVEQKIAKKWKLQYRPLLQYDVTYFDQEYMQYNPPHPVTRNMLRLKYHYNKKTQLYAYADIYHTWKKGEVKPYRMRYGTGISYLLKKRHDLGLEYVYIDEFNKREPWDVTFFNFKYVYVIRHKKSHGKEHKSTPVY